MGIIGRAGSKTAPTTRERERQHGLKRSKKKAFSCSFLYKRNNFKTKKKGNKRIQLVSHSRGFKKKAKKKRKNLYSTLCKCPFILACIGKGRNQYTSMVSRLSRASNRPPMALRRIRVAKFLGPSSSAPDGGPRGCLVG